ncbi:folate-sensitive fragile site protein Fra10Ac1 [Capsaspora owczarzaki ATCC 30864]|uniref:Folate-sensitive fragile site protein Fra10Ac1 n=1 Tax=Capsaspora owczarzaki (strain ATCC 30864) TaxID=595528 RepID=A0A0D2WHY0_CAPO3|nr:folate-sensitive fragile site protein Fra10Ac1 [Capsaspora owczarzaki ATCC 30864]KJE89330.1 folate-sensitive fragile site protein Fra10Ac1 [Capsaspora owczarzaki ATCC 30864]|eukprot:XP_004365696.2 folate-sensitive fragile site protein Fra10Ac1 [Capsaspora owczarzaki ATCC 30864]
MSDLDAVKRQHRFIWRDDDRLASTGAAAAASASTGAAEGVMTARIAWEQRLAARFYDRLFKEYCLADLRFYKEGRIALRWRTEREVLQGRGQFSCGNLKCATTPATTTTTTTTTMPTTAAANSTTVTTHTRAGAPVGDAGSGRLYTWEVNFRYEEKGEVRNALVKLRLCGGCSDMLNYRKQSKRARSPDRLDEDAWHEMQSFNPARPRRHDSNQAVESRSSSSSSLSADHHSAKRRHRRRRSESDDSDLDDDAPLADTGQKSHRRRRKARLEHTDEEDKKEEGQDGETAAAAATDSPEESAASGADIWSKAPAVQQDDREEAAANIDSYFASVFH